MPNASTGITDYCTEVPPRSSSRRGTPSSYSAQQQQLPKH